MKPCQNKDCGKEIADGQQFVRLREDRTQRSMTLFHAGRCAPAGEHRVRTMTPSLRKAIEEY